MLAETTEPAERAARPAPRGVAPKARRRRQYGALPWFRDGEGGVRIVLITTRETRRWSIPRGNPMRGKAPREAASIEAFEEAGVIGRAGRKALGAYDYEKRVDGGTVPVRVKVFPFRVSKLARRWPERKERTVRDFAPDEASSLVDEAGLAEMIGAFSPRKPRKAKKT